MAEPRAKSERIAAGPPAASGSFSRLEIAYRALEERYDALNRELEAANSSLEECRREKPRLDGCFDDILESLDSGVIAVDARGRITLFNRSAADLLGRPASEVLGRPCADLLGVGADDLLSVLSSGQHVYGREKTLPRPDGRSLPVRYNTACLRNAAGEPIGAVETFEDISRLQELARQASRVSTLTALGEMAATVAHEIRNPLGGIGGFAGLLERDLDVDDSRRRLVKKILEGVTSLNRMVTNLLNYTRPIQLNLRPADFVQVVEDAIGFFEIDAGNRLDVIELQRDYAVGRASCRIDPEQIQQIVLNLLHNAVQAMPGGGQLRVCIFEIDAAQDGRTALDVPCAALSVSDSGIGITEEIRSHLFMPFFTTKEDGNGLGLATARKVIDALGGDILVESEPDRGATFLIYVPKSF